MPKLSIYYKKEEQELIDQVDKLVRIQRMATGEERSRGKVIMEFVKKGLERLGIQ